MAGILGYHMALDQDPSGGAFGAEAAPPQSYADFGASFDLRARPEVGEFSGPALGDFNGDGIADVAGLAGPYNVGYFAGEAGSVVVALGRGDGTFAPLTSYSLGEASGRSVIVADLDGDGRLDLAVGAAELNLFNGAEGRLIVFLGNGDGTFRAAGRYALQGADAGERSFVAGDFDGDGVTDLAWIDHWAGGAVAVVRGLGSATFGAPTYYPTNDVYAWGLATGDLNEDGRPDLVSIDPSRAAVGVFLNTGNSGFGPCTEVATGCSNPYWVAAADVNGDGALDLSIVNDAEPYGVSVLAGRGDGTFASPAFTDCGYAPQQVAAGHFTDGTAFVAVISSGSLIDVLSDAGTGGFRSDVPVRAAGGTGGLDGLAVADLDGDGGSDLMYGGSSVLMSTAAHEFRRVTWLATGHLPAAVAAADLDGDGHVDAVTADRGDDTVSVLPADGHAGLGPRRSYMTGAAPCAVAVGDLNGDGRLDVVTADAGDDTVGVLLGAAGGGLGKVAQYPTGSGPDALALADVDGDGHLDVVTADGGAGTVSVLLGDGDGALSPATAYAAGAKPTDLAVTDLNGDGRLDVVTTNDDPLACSVNVLLGNGGGSLDTAVGYAHVASYASIVATDLNGDGNPDIVCGMPYWGATELLGNGDGTLQDASYLGNCAASDVAVADINGDGRPDILAGGQGGMVEALLGTGTGFMHYGYPFYTTGTVQALAVADLDGDGRSDVVVAQGSGDPGVASVDTVSVLHNTLVSPLEEYPRREDGVYYFHIQAVGTDGSRGPMTTLPVKIDSTPPVTQVTTVGGWAGTGDVATLTASDPGPAGSAVAARPRLAASATPTSGVARSEFSLDGGATWRNGAVITGAEVSRAGGDGRHTLLYRSVDNAGNVETPQSVSVSVDTTPPTPQVRSAAARTRHLAKLSFSVTDAAPCAGTAVARVKVTDLRGRVRLRLGPFRLTAGAWTTRIFTCRLKPARYRVLVYATDAAGNSQAKVARAVLRVR